MKIKNLIFGILTTLFISQLSAQSFDCSSFSVVNIIPTFNTPFDTTNATIGISSTQQSFIYFAINPVVESVYDCNGNLIGEGSPFYLWQVGGMTYDYPVTMNVTDWSFCYPITVLFTYTHNDTINTCYLTLTDSTTSISENGGDDSIIYPNPTKNQIEIKSSTNINGEYWIIYNNLGNIIATGNNNGNKINTEELVPGLYYLLLRDKIVKFIKK